MTSSPNEAPLFDADGNVVPGCEWVLAGEGEAFRLFDGLPCLVDKGFLFKLATDSGGAHWEAIEREDEAHTEAWLNRAERTPDGNYVLCGPTVNGNPEGFTRHVLVLNDCWNLTSAPRDHAGLTAYLERYKLHGVRFVRRDGRRAQFTRKEFAMQKTDEHEEEGKRP